MSLTEGTQLGVYEITGQIGAGGMGEVYRAHDRMLERDVAIKVLPPSFASDENRLARFEQEAKTLASLNHVNIAHIYGLERSDGTTALAMELVEGPTLAERIEQGPLPPAEALNIALQIADGLEAAHARSIVHRDLKPANIKLATDGTVKVLDFGIAKALDTRAISGPQAPALTTPAMTEVGIVLGTAQYMSPEQARGKPVDQRADIWAFGCVLYEMLTGQPAFGGEDVTIVLARVLERGANMDALPATVSAHVRQTIKLCLQKDPKQRIADIRDAKLALAGAFGLPALHTDTGAPAAPRGHTGMRRSVTWIVAATIGIVGVSVGWMLRPASDAPAARLSRLAIVLPPESAVGPGGGSSRYVALSPDGQLLVFLSSSANRGDYLLHTRALDRLDVNALAGTEGGDQPFFSTDGQWIGFFDGDQLKKVRADGASPPVTLVEGISAINPWGVWRGDQILYTDTERGLFQVSEEGGETSLLLEVEGGNAIRHPVLVDGRNDVVFEYGDSNGPDIEVLALDSGDRTTILENALIVDLTTSGHLLYERDDVLMAAAYDAESRQLGRTVPVLAGVAKDSAGRVPQVTVSRSGTLAYVSERGDAMAPTLAWVDRDGTLETLGQLPFGAISVSLSPGGDFAAIGLDVEPLEVFLWDMVRQVAVSLGVESMNPRWHPDGIRLGLQGEGSPRLFDVDTGIQTDLITPSTASISMPPSWTSDGETAVYTVFEPTQDLATVTIGEEQARSVIATDAQEHSPAISPDGRWLAYVSGVSSRAEVYVSQFPAGTARQQVSFNGGFAPVWSRDGQQLFFYEQVPDDVLTEMRVVDVGSGSSGAPSIGRSQSLFLVDNPNEARRSISFSNLGANYDLSLDGTKFLMVWKPIQPPSTEVIIVQNWSEELQRLVPLD